MSYTVVLLLLLFLACLPTADRSIIMSNDQLEADSLGLALLTRVTEHQSSTCALSTN